MLFVIIKAASNSPGMNTTCSQPLRARNVVHLHLLVGVFAVLFKAPSAMEVIREGNRRPAAVGPADAALFTLLGEDWTLLPEARPMFLSDALLSELRCIQDFSPISVQRHLSTSIRLVSSRLIPVNRPVIFLPPSSQWRVLQLQVSSDTRDPSCNSPA